MTLDLFSFLNNEEETKVKEVEVKEQSKETVEEQQDLATSEVNNVITLPSTANSSEDVISNEQTDEEMLEAERKKYAQEMAKQKQAEKASIRGEVVPGTFGTDVDVDAEEDGNKTSTNGTATQSAGTKKKETPTFDVNLSTFIRYSGQDIPLTTYFTEEEITVGIRSVKKGEEVVTKITEENLRKKMEDEFCELVKSLTSMNFIKDKNMILPLLSAKKKGNNHCSQGESKLDSPSFLKKTPKEIVQLKKIPFKVLEDFLLIAKCYGKSNLEVHCDIYFDYDEMDYFIDIPEQIVSPYLVEIVEEPMKLVERLIERRYIKIMEIHSHHILTATPSVIDNENEIAPGIYYAIIGRIFEYFPQITLRTYNYEFGHIVEDPNDVFQSPIQNYSFERVHIRESK